MFEALFSESGLSLDRLRALVAVGSAGSIVKAAADDPVRQSQFSRQIKELEDYFRTRLIERHGKGTRLTANGRELARISRFFMLGLSNFRRGSLAEEQTIRVGASATFNHQFLLPALFNPSEPRKNLNYSLEVAPDDSIERRLHDLTMDFGVVSKSALSRPLQTTVLCKWQLHLWVPTRLRILAKRAAQTLEQGSLPLALPTEFAELCLLASARHWRAALLCDSFLDSRVALESQTVAAFLPCFLDPPQPSRAFFKVPLAELDCRTFHFYLAWNPRLLRLNPRTVRTRDWLATALTDRIQSRAEPTHS